MMNIPPIHIHIQCIRTCSYCGVDEHPSYTHTRTHTYNAYAHAAIAEMMNIPTTTVEFSRAENIVNDGTGEMRICMHASVCVCVCVCTYACVRPFLTVEFSRAENIVNGGTGEIRICMYACVCVCVCVCTYACVRPYLTVEFSRARNIVSDGTGGSENMYVCIYVCVSLYNIYVYTCIYVCMCFFLLFNSRILARWKQCE
jgi:hypothetical protein